MENFINLTKIQSAIENGTVEEKNTIFELMHQLNVVAESVWLKTQLKNVNNEPPESHLNAEPVVFEYTNPNSQKETSGTKESGVNHTNIQLMEIGGGKFSKKNYYDEKGYVYTKTGSAAHTLYFRCRNKDSENCKARVICRGGNLDTCVLSKTHSHVPNQRSLDRSKFSKKLEEICVEFPFKKSQEIYNEAKKALRSQIDMSHIPERERFDSFIHRKLKKKIPLLAKSIEEFEKLINDPQYSASYMYDEQKKHFYHGVWRGPTGANIVFLSETVLEEIRKLKRKKKGVKLLMDGTFKSLPLHIKFRQLYIISVIIEERSYPLAYILMTRRDTKSYELIFGKLKAMIPGVVVESCMSDYEAATRKAIRIVFPEARLAGCYFHYVQAIVKAFRRFGLKDDEKFKLARQQVSALALLPNEHVTPGFNIVSKDFKKSNRWNRFADYWLRQWAPANISVYGMKDRTNNFAESLNKTINSILKASHPHIWLLIENLRMVEMNRSDELIKVSAGYMMHKKGKQVEENNSLKKIDNGGKQSKSMKIQELNEKIRNATAEFEETEDIEKFLRNVTYDENLESYFKERIFIDSVDSVLDIEQNEDFDETVIANDVCIESNFRKRFPRTASKRKLECNETTKSAKQQKKK